MFSQLFQIEFMGAQKIIEKHFIELHCHYDLIAEP